MNDTELTNEDVFGQPLTIVGLTAEQVTELDVFWPNSW